MQGIQPIRRRRIYQDLVEALERSIRNGELRAGDPLPPERELMRLFEVGRPAVREALFALQKMGLVAISTGERARVTRPTPQVIINELSGAVRHLLMEPAGMRHMQGARALFETALARYAAAHASEADVEALRVALAENRDATQDPEAFERTDVAFHYVLALIPKNPVFVAIHEGIVGWLREQRSTSMNAPGAIEAAHRAHARIFESVRARDPDRAEAAMRDHLDEVVRYYWQARRVPAKELPA